MAVHVSLMAAVGYLGLLLDLCRGGPAPENHLVLALATVLVAGVLLIVRCFRVRICVGVVDKTAVPGIQFSIRQLFILTTAVACLVSLEDQISLTPQHWNQACRASRTWTRSGSSGQSS